MFLNETVQTMEMEGNDDTDEYKDTKHLAELFNVLAFTVNLANIFVFVM
jgi:hypothetical protein